MRKLVIVVILLFVVAAVLTCRSSASASVPPIPEPTPIVGTAEDVAPEPTVVPLSWVWLPLVDSSTLTVLGPCLCYADIYNCADFADQYTAQQCYNCCMVQGLGDPHRLDRDADGVACENGTGE